MSSDAIAGGRLFALPYAPFRFGPDDPRDEARNRRILDHMRKHPLWFASAMSPEEIEATAAWMLTHPEYHKWEVWEGGKLRGMILLHRITPMVDAVVHFTLFTGTSPFAVRKLLWNFFGYAFRTYDLQRLSFEVPEHIKGLIGFLRSRCYLQYEGESRCREHSVTKFLQTKKAGGHHVPDAPTWMARQGSRREAAHWDGQKYRDVILLRLLRSEYEQVNTRTLGDEPEATRESSGETPDVAQVEAGEIPAIHAS